MTDPFTPKLVLHSLPRNTFAGENFGLMKYVVCKQSFTVTTIRFIPTISLVFEFFLNVFTELRERPRTCHFLCKRPGCYHSASKTHVRDRILN